MNSERHWLHRTFCDECHHCWEELIMERLDDRILGLTVDQTTFVCDRCSTDGHISGGVYRTIMLCLRCYKRMHKHHKLPDAHCAMCEEDRFWRNKKQREGDRWKTPQRGVAQH